MESDETSSARRGALEREIGCFVSVKGVQSLSERASCIAILKKHARIVRADRSAPVPGLGVLKRDVAGFDQDRFDRMTLAGWQFIFLKFWNGSTRAMTERDELRRAILHGRDIGEIPLRVQGVARDLHAFIMLDTFRQREHHLFIHVPIADGKAPAALGGGVGDEVALGAKDGLDDLNDR